MNQLLAMMLSLSHSFSSNVNMALTILFLIVFKSINISTRRRKTRSESKHRGVCKGKLLPVSGELLPVQVSLRSPLPYTVNHVVLSCFNRQIKSSASTLFNSPIFRFVLFFKRLLYYFRFFHKKTK